eukprot:gnl/TRDRNA2_/TRDRNA2_191978_c0_seq1.p1 gnl/TRDRNA2_/TRDRNA2_191978_c0~~gnl/TRDRNA2_/TRDRNA2_191978_c0_seq1.p1  ORF type:complete len:133 (-),score=15.67 gnl/TRDRNA2_/TRDRNA2_191978_c0_seq1:111-509(-)
MHKAGDFQQPDRGLTPALPAERYKLCKILCEKRNAWQMNTWCRGIYSSVCVPKWRLGSQTNRCVSPHAEWTEHLNTGCVVNATRNTRGIAEFPEADEVTASFCAKQCKTAMDREYEYPVQEVWDLCRTHLKT